MGCCVNKENDYSIYCAVLNVENNKSLEIDMKGSSRISNLKTILSKRERIPKKEIILSLYGKQLGDEELLVDHYLLFRMGRKLIMQRRTRNQIEITVEEKDETRMIYYLLPSATVMELKHKIESRLNVEPENQMLYYEEKEMGNEEVLHKYNMISTTNTYLICIKAKVKINIIYRLEILEMSFWSDVLIGEELFEMIENKYELGYRPMLIHRNTVLNMGDVIGKIPNNGVVRLAKPGFIIFCKSLSGDTLHLFGNSDMLIKELKYQMGDIMGGSPDQIRYIYAGKTLEDQYTLADYNLQKESTIHYMMKLRGGTC